MNSTHLTEELVLETLRQVIDPELGCNIVDLGLIYSIHIAGARVRVTMTLTTPGCPLHESLRSGAENVLLGLDGIVDVAVELVWEPPWNPSMMTAEGRAHSGLAPF